MYALKNCLWSKETQQCLSTTYFTVINPFFTLHCLYVQVQEKQGDGGARESSSAACYSPGTHRYYPLTILVPPLPLLWSLSQPEQDSRVSVWIPDPAQPLEQPLLALFSFLLIKDLQDTRQMDLGDISLLPVVLCDLFVRFYHNLSGWSSDSVWVLVHTAASGPGPETENVRIKRSFF